MRPPPHAATRKGPHLKQRRERYGRESRIVPAWFPKVWRSKHPRAARQRFRCHDVVLEGGFHAVSASGLQRERSSPVTASLNGCRPYRSTVAAIDGTQNLQVSNALQARGTASQFGDQCVDGSLVPDCIQIAIAFVGTLM